MKMKEIVQIKRKYLHISKNPVLRDRNVAETK